METKGVKSVFGNSHLSVGVQRSSFVPLGKAAFVSCHEGAFQMVFCLDAAAARELAAQLTAVADDLDSVQPPQRVAA